MSSDRRDLPVTPDMEAGTQPGAAAPRAVARSESTGPRFRILRPHAKGGLGEVFLAEDRELQRHVALKEMQFPHAGNQDSRGRFVLEAVITGGLEHPNIVPVYGLGTYDDGRPYYAMRFILGESMKEAIARFHATKFSGESERNLAFRDLLRRFTDACNAIAYAHNRGVLHRDLKPDNIMLGQFGETLVVDWGVAKEMRSSESGLRSENPPSGGELASADSSTPHSAFRTPPTQTQAGSLIGTPAYSSPEQAAGNLAALGPASDVYSLGATLFAILTGVSPFRGDLADVLAKVEANDFPKPTQMKPGVPPPLEAVVLQAMAKRPEDRYASASALAEEIEHYLGDEPVAAYPEPRLARLKRWARKHPGGVAGLAAALVVGLFGLTAGLYFVNAERQQTEQARQAEAREKAKAQAARDQAGQRFRLALDAYNDMILGIQDKLENRPGTQDLRKDLLDNARSGLKKLLDQPHHRVEPDGLLVWTYYRMGDLEQSFGNLDAARREYQTGLELAENIHATDPAGPQTRRNVGIGYAKLGDIASRNRQLTTALDYFQKSQAIREVLLESDPDDVLLRWDVGVLYERLGDVLIELGRIPEAREYFEKCRVTRTQFVAANPKNADALRNLTIVHDRLADVALALNKPEEAGQYLKKSLEQFRNLAANDPFNTVARRDLGVALNRYGDVLIKLERYEEAMAPFRESLTVTQALADADPQNAESQRDVSVSLTKLGELHFILDKPAEAQAYFEKSLTIAERLERANPKSVEAVRDLAVAHSKLGHALRAQKKHAEALAAYRRMKDLVGRLTNPKDLNLNLEYIEQKIAECEAALKKR